MNTSSILRLPAPFADLTIGLVGLDKDRRLGILAEVQRECVSLDPRFCFYNISANDPELQQRLSGCGFVVIADDSAASEKVLELAIDMQVIPIVRANCGLDERVSSDNLWEDPAAAARRIDDIRATPDSFKLAQDDTLIQGQPKSNGSRYYERSKVRIGIICDRFYWDSMKDAADFVYVTPQDWQDKISEIDCFLYVTAWSGIHGEWPDLFHEKKPNRLTLYEIIDTCRKAGKPTIFYSKEDPPHYAESINIAKRCDYVFTTCAEIIPQYKQDCGHDRVRSLCFGINPMYHNPVGMCLKKHGTDVIFSGSWSTRYPKRCAELGAIFDGVLSAGCKLNIIDRNYARMDNPDFAFPEKYRPYQHPSLDHDVLQAVHKRYDWAVNINTVQDSHTMFANRVYELQASGNLLLSNYSLGVSEKFPGVFIVKNSEDVARILGSIRPREVYERQVAGVRRVMTGETCYDRLFEILSPLGLVATVLIRKVAVIVRQITPQLKEMFDLQSYPNKILVEEGEAKQATEDCDLIAFWSQDYQYGPYYLEDMINGFKYTDSDYITKLVGREHIYVDSFSNKNRTVFWKKSFNLDDLIAHDGPMARGRGYSIDHFNLSAGDQNSLANGGISIVIPTWRDNPYLAEAVRSVLQQDYPQDKIEVLLAVNGGDRAYYDKLLAAYAAENRVHVLFTERKGVNAGRNIGIAAARFPLLTFLDDDDQLTTGFLRILAEGFSAGDVDVSVGPLAEMSTNKPVPNSVYAKAFSSIGTGVISDYCRLQVGFSSFPGKLYRTALFRNVFGVLDETEAHTEDVIFWAENIGKLIGGIYVSDLRDEEFYLRRVRPDSLSRPSADNLYRFSISDRLHIIDRLTAVLFDPNISLTQKDFVLEKLRIQEAFMLRYINNHPKDGDRARKEILAYENTFLNKSKFSKRRAIAFCHNFSPFVDASAFVATKRLREIERLEGEPLQWHVISQDMSKVRTADDTFHRYYAEQSFQEFTMLTEPSGFMPAMQVPYGNAAFGLAKNEEAQVIYSRSLFVGSHIAAYQYKKKHPKVKWYAEFSDPTAYGVDNRPRACTGTPDWFYIERMVYTIADHIIFTNANQMAFMLSYNPSSDLNERIRKRAIIMHHPILPRAYCNLVRSDYALDVSKINIGYFGTFYMTRKADDMLRLLDNPQVVLHVFTTKPDELRQQLAAYGESIRVNSTVSPFEMLNLGAKMDYLYLNDTEFPGEINPFLPSKYADYLTTETPIIAKIQPGSVIAKTDHKGVIKVSDLTPDFVAKLQKKSSDEVNCPGVSVIIPTWRKNITLCTTVKSVLSQDYPENHIQVYVCINGGDESYRKELERAYLKEPRVSVLFTDTVGPNAGRNLGLRAAETPLITFVDDDDTLTPGYLRELSRGFANPEVTISFGRMVDLNEKGMVTEDTYINRALATTGGGDSASYIKASSLLSTLCGKMYRTDFFRQVLGTLDELEHHSEDMLFWAERFNRLVGLLHFCSAESHEAYVRHVVNNSLSRPSSDTAYAFYVTDRIRIIERLQTIYDNTQSQDHRKVLLSKIRAQKRTMRDYISKLPTPDRIRAERTTGELMNT